MMFKYKSSSALNLLMSILLAPKYYKMDKTYIINQIRSILAFVLCLFIMIMSTSICAGAKPKFDISLITEPNPNVPSFGRSLVQWNVTNNLSIPRTIALTNRPQYASIVLPESGLAEACPRYFSLRPNGHCLLSMLIESIRAKYCPIVCTCPEGKCSPFECSTTTTDCITNDTSTSSTTTESSILIAVGSYTPTNISPAYPAAYIAQYNYDCSSTTGTCSGRWSYIEPLATTNSQFYGSTCFTNGTTPTCVAVGTLLSEYTPSGEAILYQMSSTNQWVAGTIQSTLAPAVLNSVACYTNTSNNDSTSCIAVGQSTDNYPIVLYNLDVISSTIWTDVTPPNTSINFNYNTSLSSVSCNDLVCVAAGGTTLDEPQAHILIQTPATDVSINSWTPATGVEYQSYNTPSYTSCTESICVSGDIYGIFQNTDQSFQSDQWNQVESAESITFATSSNISCSNSGTCLAFSNYQYIQTTNTGVIWSATDTASDDIFFNGVSCVGSTTSNTLCVAAGGASSTTTPLVNYQIAAGSWTTLSLSSSTTANSYFNSVSCLGSYPNILCIMAGEGPTPSVPPLQILSVDSSGIPFAVNARPLPTNSSFYSTSSTTVTTNSS